MDKEERVYLSKEEAIKIALIKDGKIHNFVNPSFGLIGTDWSKKDFEECLNLAETIEVGGSMCRGMNHAIAVIKDNDLYFFEHNEDELVKLLKSKGLK